VEFEDFGHAWEIEGMEERRVKTQNEGEERSVPRVKREGHMKKIDTVENERTIIIFGPIFFK